MRTSLKAIAALGVLGATIFGSVLPVLAQYYPYPPPPPPPPPPGYYGGGYYGAPPPPPPGYYPPPPDYGYRPCPRGFTVQDGVCKPYRGPVGGDWRTWNGCPPGFTVQGGECRAYRGR